MKEKVETYTSKNKKIQMKVIKDETGKKVISVEHANGNKKVEQGNIIDLKLANEAEKRRGFIDNIADNSTIETHASPVCFWYFFSGKWYKICL